MCSLALISTIVPSLVRAQGDSLPALTGPYLGQRTPDTIPELFAPGIVSKDGHQAKLNICSDQSEIIYWERNPANNSMYFVSITKTGKTWNAPETLAFSREFTNMEPALSPDGTKLYFVSDRPPSDSGGAQKNPDIWYVRKVAGRWSEPVNIGPPINGDGVEVQPCEGADGNFYFCKSPGEIYCSRISDGKMQQPIKLTANINTGRVSSPRTSPDHSCLIFHSERAGGFGGWDLYVSFKDDSGNWSEAKNLGGSINTSGNENDATFSPDGKYLFFTREGDIYWVSAAVIEDLRRKY
jgi:dipeptidyl aminopeptidase/acylaminoacyl peptidase